MKSPEGRGCKLLIDLQGNPLVPCYMYSPCTNSKPIPTQINRPLTLITCNLASMLRMVDNTLLSPTSSFVRADPALLQVPNHRLYISNSSFYMEKCCLPRGFLPESEAACSWPPYVPLSMSPCTCSSSADSSVNAGLGLANLEAICTSTIATSNVFG